MDYKLPKRIENSNKSTYGRVLNLAGSDYMPGAAYLSSVAALKTGCGYCFLCSTDRVIDIVAAKTSNLVFIPRSKLSDNLNNFDVVEAGCGLSQDEVAEKALMVLLHNLDRNTPLILDADALNIIAKNRQMFLPQEFKKVVMTPHPKEAARLLDCTTEDVLSDVKLAAETISKKYNTVTALKTHKTVVTSTDGRLYQNGTGNNAMAKAGSGDVLTGMIAGLIAQGKDLFEGTALGVYLHGLCGDCASKYLTRYSVMADDLIVNIPKAIDIYSSGE